MEGPECCEPFFERSPPVLWRAPLGWPQALVHPLLPPDAASSCEQGAVEPAAATSSCGTGARPATLPGTGQEETANRTEHAVKQKHPSTATKPRSYQALSDLGTSHQLLQAPTLLSRPHREMACHRAGLTSIPAPLSCQPLQTP